ncbi:DNA repair protein RecN [Peptoanaerobacter stomatis]|uniref:DNA repair protein RecN n=1 Tax=Peptoanaerobacter stomatis TaxID=796937 RepID=J5WHI3_9FIRM|nr:DNA repair protein RecN [Peptoanaerobacter stomatis]EJU21997.1 DNA repair protein RecN [Peptoanaerobacter stomatis]
MLKQLYIENFALIDKLELEMENGFTVFTGETGSGKSIMIDAISFAIGKRADKTFVRKGTNKSIIELIFFIKDNMKKLLENMLKEENIDIEDNIIILKREIYSDGRSLCKINSKNVNTSFLKKISSYLINIHGQNEFNELEETNHINILDSYIGLRKMKQFKEYISLYSSYIKLSKEYEDMYSNYDKEKNKRELELLKYQINEIEELKLKKGEDKNIEDRLEIMDKSVKISKCMNGLYEELYGKTNNILKVLRMYMQEFENFSDLDDNLKSISEKLNDEYYNIEELSYEVRDNLGRYDFDEDRKTILEDRYDEINRIYSKYAQGYDKLKEYLQNAYDEVEFYEKYEDKIKDIKKQLSQLDEKLKNISANITSIRTEKKTELEKLIVDELATLGMKNVAFDINISPLDTYNNKGNDNVIFLISFNKGEDTKPFSKIASGGEISRFMLALKNVISSEFEKTMVFDEIDTGISGLASEKVGKKLKDISRVRQVLCITHQGQIASYAQNHIEVFKTEEDDNTLTKAKILSEKERIVEIAKMMDASTDSIKSLEHAKELLSKNSR